MESQGHKKKPAKIPERQERQLLTSQSLVHHWCVMSWYLKVHWFKQLLKKVQTPSEGPAIIPLSKETGSIYYSEMNVVKGANQPYNKSSTLWRHCWLLVRESHCQQWKKICTSTDWKATQQGRSRYSERNIKSPPDYSLQTHTHRKSFISGDMSCGLVKLKFNCLVIMTYGRKETKLAPT